MNRPIDPTAFRVIDANVNRAREALRVMEEYARFGLDDAGLTKAIKETRHRLAQAVADLAQQLVTGEGRGTDQAATPLSPPLPRGEDGRGDAGEGLLVRSRDIVGDVGREIGTESEYERTDAVHAALAAAKRLSEALRTIEEYGKTIDPSFAARVEQIRYEGYELERRLTITVHARQRFGHVRLYVILTESLCHGDWFTTAEAALRGGADCLQLREKDLTDRELLNRAKRLAALCHEHGALFILNDRPDLAVLCGADGVHLGQDDIPVSAARRIVPPTCLVGTSTHTIEQIEDAITQAPDYLAVGPMFATPTKPQDHIAGPETLAAARQRTSLPLVAIGGINEHNVGAVLSGASCCICVCQAVIAQPDAEEAAAHLRGQIDRALSQQTTTDG